MSIHCFISNNIYPADSGHSILCVLKKEFRPGADLTNSLLPVPVKAVLRKYSIDNGYVVVDLPYDSNFGLEINTEDDEF